MDPLFVCPLPTTLPDMPTQACPERFDQIQRFAFQIIPTTSSFSATTILVQATWTPLLTAVDLTKVIITPRMPGVTIPSGEVITEGGNDNTTINGIARYLGRGFVGVTAQMQDADSGVRAALRALTPFSSQNGYTGVWVYMFNRFNQIIANADGTGVPVYNFSVGDVGTEGFNRPNIAPVNFSLEPGWSDNVKLFNPTAPFKPLNL